MHGAFAVVISNSDWSIYLNLAKATAIVIVVALVVALVGASASAQQPTPLPHVQIGIPVTPPPGWMPKQWADLRAHCQEIADKAAAHQPLAPDEWHVAPICGSLGPQPTPPPGSYPLPVSSGASAPMVTPEPSPSPAGSDPQSALDPEFLAALRMIESRR